MPRRKLLIPGFGSRLKEIIRDNYGGVEYRLAKAMGDVAKYKGRISDWATGDVGLDAFSVRRLCRVTGYSADWLLLGELPKRRGEARERADVEQELASRLSADIAAQLSEEGVAADEVDVDVERVLKDAVARLASELRKNLRADEDGRAILCHAVALDGLAKFLGRHYENTKVPENLRERYRKVLLYAENRSRDIESFVRSGSASYSGVSIGRYWDRRYAAEVPEGMMREITALRSLAEDEARDKPYLNAFNPHDRNFTKATREEILKRTSHRPAAKKPARTRAGKGQDARSTHRGVPKKRAPH